MNALELKIPPPLVALLAAGLMYGLAQSGPEFALPVVLRSVAVAILVAVGIGFDMAGLLSFRRARTTVNPLKPDATTQLVTSGIYRYTRNPMYVGMLCLLLAWVVWLAAPWAIVGPALFAVWITRFQIQPEERVLERVFGEDFKVYRRRTRRWL